MGQIRNRKPVDMMGVEFQTWKVIASSDKKGSGNNAYWLCECQVCSNQKLLCGTEIRLGRTGACKHPVLKNNYFKSVDSNSHKIKNEVGNRYGRLVVSNFAYTKNSCAYWECKCDCGKTTIVRGNTLRNGDTLSCGCLISRKEEEIENILINNNIHFIRQYSFPDLKDRGLLRFDFAILGDNDSVLGLIEYQGIQHYYKQEGFGDFELQQKHDQMKRIYCQNKNIPLLELNKNNSLAQDILCWCETLPISPKN